MSTSVEMPPPTTGHSLPLPVVDNMPLKSETPSSAVDHHNLHHGHHRDHHHHHVPALSAAEKTQAHPLHQFDMTIMSKFYESCVSKLSEHNGKFDASAWQRSQPMPQHASWEQKYDWPNPLVLSHKQRVYEAFARLAHETGEPMILMPNFDYGDVLHFERFLQALKMDGVNAIGKYKQYLNNKEMRKFEIDLVVVHPRYGILLFEIKDCDHLDAKRRSRARLQLSNARACFEAMGRLIIEAKGWPMNEATVPISEFIALPNAIQRPPTHSSAHRHSPTSASLAATGAEQQHNQSTASATSSTSTSSASAAWRHHGRQLNYMIKSDVENTMDFAEWWIRCVAEPKVQLEQSLLAENKSNRFDADALNWMLGLINCVRSNSVMPVVYAESDEATLEHQLLTRLSLHHTQQQQQQQQQPEEAKPKAEEKEEKKQEEDKKQEEEQQQQEEKREEKVDESSEESNPESEKPLEAAQERDQELKSGVPAPDQVKPTPTVSTSGAQLEHQPALKIHGEFLSKWHEQVRSMAKVVAVSADGETLRKMICMQTLWLMLNESQKKISVVCSDMNKAYYEEFFARQRKLYNNFHNVRFYSDLNSCAPNAQHTLKNNNEVWFFDAGIRGSLSDVLERATSLHSFWIFSTECALVDERARDLTDTGAHIVKMDAPTTTSSTTESSSTTTPACKWLSGTSMKLPLRLHTDLLIIGDIIGNQQLRPLYRYMKNNVVASSVAHQYTSERATATATATATAAAAPAANERHSHHHRGDRRDRHAAAAAAGDKADNRTTTETTGATQEPRASNSNGESLSYSPAKKFKTVKFLRGNTIDNLRNSLKMHDSIQASVVVLHVGDEDLFKTRASLTTVERIKELTALVREYLPRAFIVISTLVKRMSRTENALANEVNKGIAAYCKQTKDTVGAHYMLNSLLEPEYHTQEGRSLTVKGLKLYVDNILFVVDHFMVKKHAQH